MKTSARIAALAALVSLGAAGAPLADTYETSVGAVSVEAVATGLDSPWAFAFLPDGALLITEVDGTMRIHRDGALSAPLGGVPEVVASRQGGLLDVVLSDDYAETGEIFFSYSAPADGGRSQTAVARARLVDDASPRLENVEVIFRQEPAQRSGVHFGSRIVVAGDGSLFVTIGDRGEREKAQNPAAHQGSVIRILKDGAPHPENPFVDGGRGWKPEIFSYGHRNPQGATLDASGVLWTVEHGAKGGDEVNRPVAGGNFGWPTISYGRHYSGAKIGVGADAPGMIQPQHYWDPSIAPSGLAHYEGDLFPGWRGDLFVGALKYQLIVRLDVENGRVVGQEPLFQREYGRIRDVRAGPDGAIWFATDRSDGAIYRVAPANPT